MHPRTANRAANDAVDREASPTWEPEHDTEGGSLLPVSGDGARFEVRNPRHRLRLRMATNRGIFFTVNVSLDGACTELLRVPPVGSRLDGHIFVDGKSAPFKGRVAWARVGEPRLNQLGRVGLRFERIDLDLAPVIEKWRQGLASQAVVR